MATKATARASIIVGLVFLAAAAPGHAATVNNLSVLGGGKSSGVAAQLGCSGGSGSSACQAVVRGGSAGALTAAGWLDGEAAHLFKLKNNSPATVAAALNFLAGSNFGKADAVRLGPRHLGGSCSDTACRFQTNYLWLVLKLGKRSVFVKNTTEGLLTLDLKVAPGAGAGLSGVTFFEEGSVNPVPAPAPLAMLLSAVAGLAGFFWIGRRRTSEETQLAG